MPSIFDLRRSHAPPALRCALLACLTTALLAACGGGGSGGDATSAQTSVTPPATTPTLGPVPTEVSLAASTAGSLVDYFKQKLKQGPVTSTTTVNTAVPVGAVASPAPTAASPSADAGVSFSGTTLQERGVDENDWVKTDGAMVYGLAKAYSNGGTPTAALLQAQRRQADGQLSSVGRLTLPNELTYTGMYLVGSANRLALLGQRYQFFDPLASGTPAPAVSGPAAPSAAPVGLSIAPASGFQEVGIDLVATPTSGTGSSTATLSVANRIRLDGNLVGSRVIGSTLYVVSSWSPNLGKYAIPATATPAQTEAILASLTSADILPKIRVDGRPAEPLMADTDCYVQTGNASPMRELTTITAFNLASPTLQRSSRCFVGGSQALYVSPAAVYVATSRYAYVVANTMPTLGIWPANAKTDVHKFALAGMTIDYRGSGEVTGNLGWEADKNAYRMSEYQGDLRILTFTGQQGWSTTFNGTSTTARPVPAASPATLSVLRENSNTTTRSLQVVSTLPNTSRPAAIGKPGEQIFAVQYVGPRAYVVTFRRTDPLYVLDLSNPADPKTVGELEIPGYSDYLYPLGDSLLLGVGKDANDSGVVQGVKVALMDVADPAKPSIRNSLTLGKRGSASGLDSSSRGINIFQQGDVFRIGLPVRLNETPIANSAGFFNPTTQGLARFEVDTKAKTLVTKPTIVGLTYPTNTNNPYSLAFGQYDLGQERSVQIEGFVYYFSGGSFLVSPW